MFVCVHVYSVYVCLTDVTGGIYIAPHVSQNGVVVLCCAQDQLKRFRELTKSLEDETRQSRVLKGKVTR